MAACPAPQRLHSMAGKRPRTQCPDVIPPSPAKAARTGPSGADERHTDKHVSGVADSCAPSPLGAFPALQAVAAARVSPCGIRSAGATESADKLRTGGLPAAGGSGSGGALPRLPAPAPSCASSASSDSDGIRSAASWTPSTAPLALHAAASAARPPAAASSPFLFASEAPLPTRHGDFVMRVYACAATGKEATILLSPAMAAAVGGDGAAGVPLLRVHDACATSELFGSVKCDCAAQLEEALRLAQAAPGAGGGVLYLAQEGRGIGLANKVAAYALQAGCGRDTVDANRALGLPDDAREYGAVRDILAHLRVGPVRLLSNNPRKEERLRALGVPLAGRQPLHVQPPSQLAAAYLATKVARMAHDAPA